MSATNSKESKNVIQMHIQFFLSKAFFDEIEASQSEL